MSAAYALPMEPHLTPKRQRAMYSLRLARPLLLVVLALLAAACSGSGSGATPAPTDEIATAGTGDAAMAAVRARSPLFDGIEERDPDLIGQGSWWQAEPLDSGSPPAGWRVTVEVGWGDCPAGCIDRHTWTWEVARDGEPVFVSEEGSVLAEDVLAALRAASTSTGVGGWATAGPTCPVERPGDPACAPRMVDGADLVIRNAGGAEAARFTTDGSGLFRVVLPQGDYTLEASQVEGFMGTPGPMPLTVTDGAETWLDVPYDTGIR